MKTIKEIQAQIADTTISVLFYITTPVLILSLLRVIELGWLSVMWLHVGAYFFLSIIYFRKQVNYRIKVSFVLLFFTLIGIGSMLHNQQIASGSPFFIIATMLLMIHSNRRMTLVFIAFFAVLEFSYVFWLNQVSIHHILSVIAYLALGYIVIDMMGYLKNSLITLLNQSRQQANQIQQIIDATKVGTWKWNVQTGEATLNERWAQTLGYTLAELSPINIQTWKNLSHSDDLKTTERCLKDYFDGKTDFYQTDFRMKHKDGHWVWINDRGQTTQRDTDGSPIWMSGTHTDITERKFAEEQMRLSSIVFSNSQEGILISDKNNCIVDINPACLALTGYTREEVIGQNPCLFSSGTYSKEFYDQMWLEIVNSGHWQGEILNRKKTGEIYSERLSIDSVSDENGKLQHYVAVFYDITYLKEHEAELEFIAYNDALTGLPNRLLLRDRMQQSISKVKREDKQLAVCYLDLDGFKPINDIYGHKSGDGILIEVGKRLQNVLGADDTVARIGGDEFVLLVTINTISELKQTLELVLTTISMPYKITNDTEVREVSSISASIGLTLYPQDNSEEDILLRHADQAMYSSKQRGKNRYSFFDPSEEEKVSAEQKLQKEVEIALEKNQFELFYQPKVNMHTGEVIGAEALIRWMHPEKGLLSPGAFLSSIEHTPLIIEVGNWVLHQAMSQMRLWLSQGINLKVSVNIDAMHLQQKQFIPSLQILLDEFNDISASSLELEILETSALHDIDSVSEVIRKCSQLGVQFSLDDFGTGYSSLSYLKHLPAQVLKIDQSFIRNLLENQDDLAIVEGILGLAHAFHRTPIAEGVETIATGTLLLNLGCQLAQGYAIARPMPAKELPQWIDKFQIPTQWKESNNALNSEVNYSLTQMYINHHHIVLRVRHAIEQRVASLIPEHFQNHDSCKIGKWLATEGKERYGQFAEFGHITEKHKKLHELIKKSTEILKTKDDNKSLQQNSNEINKLSNDILDCLNRLRNMSIE